MKTAANLLTTALVAALGFGFGAAPEAFAQQPAAKDSGPIISSVPGPSSAQKTGALPSSLDMPVLGGDEKGKDKDKSDKNDIPAPSPKVPDSVKSVIKKLNTATQDVTLEDLNSAREAVAKLDVLIDIEKRLNDLTTLRLEREEKNAASLAAALPASALGLPPSKGGSQSVVPLSPIPEPMPMISAPAPIKMAPPVPTGPSDFDVVRISGVRGSYIAMVREADGKTKRVREGDKMPDGSLVEAVSRNGVTLSKDSKKKTIQVSGVPQIFGER